MVAPVITLSHGPALVVGFEEKLKDDKRRNQVLAYYASGVDQTKMSVAGKRIGSKSLRKLKKCSEGKTAVVEQLECLQYDAKSNKKKPMSLNIRNPKRFKN